MLHPVPNRERHGHVIIVRACVFWGLALVVKKIVGKGALKLVDPFPP